MGERRHQGQHGPDCFGCRIQSVNVSPAAFPTRRNTTPPVNHGTGNNWERGIPTDHRGMPYLDAGLDPMHTKELANGGLDRIETALRAERSASQGVTV